MFILYNPWFKVTLSISLGSLSSFQNNSDIDISKLFQNLYLLSLINSGQCEYFNFINMVNQGSELNEPTNKTLIKP